MRNARTSLGPGVVRRGKVVVWKRGGDSNPRPLGYEPNELPLLHPAARRPRPGAAPGGAAAASPPGGSPPQYSPALRRVTIGFGMGPGGSAALSATGPPGARRPGVV